MEEKVKFEYRGNTIPLVIKIVWIILISWGAYYLLTFALPDLKLWTK